MKKISITKTDIQEGGEISSYNSVGVTKYDKKAMFESWYTSKVVEIIDDNNFKTIYSKYSWKYEND